MKSWNKIRLGDACQTNFDTYSLKDDWSFVNYLDTSNIVDNKIDEIQFIDVTKEELPSRARRKVRHNSIIYSTVRPDQRHFGIIKSQPDNFLVSTGFAVIDVDPTILDADFLYYKLSQNSIVETLHSIAAQSTSAYPAIKPSDLENLELEIPNIETQAKIGKFLRNLDDKIRHNTAINDNLSHYLDLIYDFWFSQFDFPNKDNIPYKSNYGEMIFSQKLRKMIPQGWEVVPLKNIATISSESVIPQAKTEYIHYSIPSFDEHRLPKVELGSLIGSTKYKVSSNMILVSKLNPQFKRVWLINNAEENSICSTEFIPFQAKDIPIEYLFGILNSYSFNKYMIQCSSSSTGSRKRMTPELCLQFSVALPPSEIINEYSSKVRGALKYISDNLYENSKLNTIRKTLLPLLMNGQATISD